MLIDEFLPACDVAQRHGTLVHADADATYEAVRRLDLARSLPVRVLFAARGIARPTLRSGARPALTLDALLRIGFVVLAERPADEIVLGLVGRPWTPSGGIRRIPADGFAPFAEPGYAKAAWNFRISDAGGGRCRLETETRVLATDPVARRRFLRYWRVIAPLSGYIRREALALIRRAAEQSRS